MAQIPMRSHAAAAAAAARVLESRWRAARHDGQTDCVRIQTLRFGLSRDGEIALGRERKRETGREGERERDDSPDSKSVR